MACVECERGRLIDGAEPDCATVRGCPIPPLGERGARVMALHETLHRLKGLADPAAILAAYGATRDDLDMVAMVEKILGERASGRARRE